MALKALLTTGTLLTAEWTTLTATTVRALANLYTNGNIIYINRDGPAGDQNLYLYHGLTPTGALLRFVESEDRFTFNHRLDFGGNLSDWNIVTGSLGVRAGTATSGPLEIWGPAGETYLAARTTAVDAVASMTVPLASESGTTPVLRTPVERVYLRLGAPARGIMRAVLMQWVRAHFVAQREKASAEQALWTRDEDTMMGGLKD